MNQVASWLPFLSPWTGLKTAIISSVIILLGNIILQQIVVTWRDPRHAPKSDFGLVPVESFEPERIKNGIDPIFVHGLSSNPDTTWEEVKSNHKFTGGDSDSSSGKERVNWIRDFLSQDLPPSLKLHARAFFYNYNSHWERDAIETRRTEYGNDLFHRLVDLSTENPDRTFILVGYSYGGLIIKEALIKAQSLQLHRAVNVFKQTKAVVFLGTPHRGTKVAWLGVKQAKFYSLCGLGPSISIVEALQYDRAELRDMHRHFEGILGDMRIVNFYEKKKSSMWGYGIYLVKEESATLDHPKSETWGLGTDHKGLNKFGSRNSDYKTIRDKLIRLMVAVSEDVRVATSIYSVPETSTKLYKNRKGLSGSLEEVLHEKGQILALIGLGGTGKTQIALRYAERNQQRYNVILWIDARSESTIRSSLNRCAQALGFAIPTSHMPTDQVLLKDDTAVQLVLAWLQTHDETHGEWLLIVDNADGFDTGVQYVIPPKNHGNIIITSRNTMCLSILPAGSRRINVGNMEPSEAQSLLLQHMNLSVKDAAQEVRDLALRVCEELERLALAVHLAGTYIRASSVDDGSLGNTGYSTEETVRLMKKYLQNFKRHKDEMLKAETSKGLSSYDQTVWTVWDASLHSIEKTFPGLPSRRLLTFLAHMDASKIPDDIFQLAAKDLTNGQDELTRDLPDWLVELLLVDDGEWDKFKFEQALKPLERYGLVESSNSKGYHYVRMHALVRWKAKLDDKHAGNAPWTKFHATFFVCAVRQAASDDTLHTLWDFIGLHAPAPDALLSAQSKGVHATLHIIGELYFHARRWVNAQTLHKRLVEMSKEVYGEQHPHTLAVMLNHAAILPTQQPSSEADNVFRQNVPRFAEVVKEWSSLLTSFALSRMASACSWDGRFREALELQTNVTTREVMTVGDPFFLTVSSIEQLVYGALEDSRWRDAEVAQEAVIKRVKEIYGDEHFETLSKITKLIPIYRAQ